MSSVEKRFFLPGEIISGTDYFYSSDHLSSVRELTDSMGAITMQYQYNLFGQKTKSGSIESSFNYAGYYSHERSGLLATLYRFYKPELGRWLSRDPLGEIMGTNLFGYVLNSPVSSIDPFGLEVYVVTSPGFGGAGGAQHVFAWGTEVKDGAGRGGMFGDDWGRKGYPDGFDCDKPKFCNWPKNKVNPDKDGLYNGKTEAEFIKFLQSKKAGLNSGPFVPGINDCHNSLRRGFNRAGVAYPGSPLGRFGKLPPPPPPPDLMPKLTKSFVNNVPYPERGQIIYRDELLPGFGLRVTPGSKTYVVEARVQGVARRITLGRDGVLTPASARKKARKLQVMMAAGKDPVLERRKKEVVGVTLDEVKEQYLSVRNLRANTQRAYRYMLPRCLGDWLDLPIAAITREMVEQRHIELRRTTKQGTNGEAQANTVMNILGTLFNFAEANYEVDGKPIILVNPVKRLSQNRRWYQNRRRQTVVPNHKLPDWFSTVTSLRHPTVRDYLLLLLFTGLRRNEAATLRWKDIDLEAKVLTIRAEIAKNGNEHRLPLSDFLFDLLSRRFLERGESEWVFTGRDKKRHLIDSDHVIRGVAKTINCKFTCHDLRRNFLTVAERLELSYVVLKKLANHAGKNDTTFGYVVVDVERLREPMQRITNELLHLCKSDINRCS